MSGNVKRDERNLEELERLGWKVLVVWGCETKDVGSLTRKLSRFMSE